MGAITITDEFTSPVPAGKLFKGLILDADNLIPKLMPQAYKNIETIEGDEAPEASGRLPSAKASSQYKYLKHGIDTLDKENMKYSYTLIEGGPLMDQIESISYEIKFGASPDGGCKGTYVSKYTPKSGIEINEEEIKAGKAKAMAAFKAVEAYLLANPEVYA